MDNSCIAVIFSVILILMSYNNEQSHNAGVTQGEKIHFMLKG